MAVLTQDLRYALRQLRRAPGFTLTVVLTLALGIGASAAVFTLFDQVLLRMLPVEHPKQLVRFEWTGAFQGSASSFGGDEHNYFSYPMYKDLRDQNQVFSGVAAADKAYAGVSWHNQSEDQDAEVVSGNYFQVLGLKPFAGRLLAPQDDTAKNANPVLVLSYNYWRLRFNASRDVIGQTLLVNGHPFTIVGVAPPNFDTAIGGYKPGIFLPISMVEVAIPFMEGRDDLTSHKSIWITLVARLKPGITPQQAEASLQPVWHSLRAYELSLYKSHSARFDKGFLDNSRLKVVDDSRGFAPDRLGYQKPLVILMGMSGVLVVLCAINVATLLLLRAANRAREMSMRYALGAKRSRIVSQLLVEGGLFGLAGTAAGLAVAPMVAAALVRLMTGADPGSEPYSTSIDARILLFTLAIALTATLLFSIAPVLHYLRPNLAHTLRQNSGTASKSSQRFRKFAVGAQIALSVLLLAGAGLFVRTVDNLRRQPVGFDPSHLVKFSLDPANAGLTDQRGTQAVMDSIATVARIPGVVSAAGTTDPELSGDDSSSNFSIQGYKAAEDENMDFERASVTPGYFATLHLPLLAGREFTASDAKGQPNVAVVNLALAKRFFATPRNAIGRAIAHGAGSDVKYDTTIIGVVGDIRHVDVRTPLGPAVYQPYLQQPRPGSLDIYVQTVQPPQTAEGSIRAAMRQFNSALVVDGLRTMNDQIDRTMNGERAIAVLALGFAIVALVMAAVGLYGVLAYSTEQRTREIGVRLALGAPRSSVVALVVREMVLIAAIATAIALPCTVALARLFTTQLYGVTAFDPFALVAAVALTMLMIAVAGALPARRAASVEPVQALRAD
ncbi:MAG: ABC transporter permease [Terracidiphilus sp.]